MRPRQPKRRRPSRRKANTSHASMENTVLWSQRTGPRWPYKVSLNSKPASRVADSNTKPAVAKRKVRRSSVSSGKPACGSAALRILRSARVISQACTTAAANRPYEEMPKAQCSGNHGEALTCSSLPGNTSASRSAAEPRPARAQRASSWGNICRSTAYTVSTSQAVTERAGAKPNRCGSANRPRTSTTAWSTHAASRAMRAARSERRAPAAAGTA